MGKVLGLDSSGGYIAVAVLKDGVVLSESSLLSPNGTLRSLVPAIHAALAPAGIEIVDLDLIAVTTGPGSWTGLRIGVETAKTMAQVADVPLVGISTLEASAANIQFNPTPVVCLFDAKRDAIIYSVFDCSSSLPRYLIEPSQVTRHALPSALPEKALILGDAGLMGNECRNPRWSVLGRQVIRGSSVCELGWRTYQEFGPVAALTLEPNYMQASGADMKAASHKG